MILLVDLTAAPSVEAVRRALKGFEEETGLQVVLQHHDLFKATGEISMR